MSTWAAVALASGSERRARPVWAGGCATLASRHRQHSGARDSPQRPEQGQSPAGRGQHRRTWRQTWQQAVSGEEQGGNQGAPPRRRHLSSQCTQLLAACTCCRHHKRQAGYCVGARQRRRDALTVAAQVSGHVAAQVALPQVVRHAPAAEDRHAADCRGRSGGGDQWAGRQLIA